MELSTKVFFVSELSADDLMDQCERHLIIRTDCADKAVNVLQAQLGITKYKILTPHTISLKEYVGQSEVVNKTLITEWPCSFRVNNL